jgi:hypothetical protein
MQWVPMVARQCDGDLDFNQECGPIAGAVTMPKWPAASILPGMTHPSPT